MSDVTLERPAAASPNRFTQAELGWVAWIDPVPEEAL